MAQIRFVNFTMLFHDAAEKGILLLFAAVLAILMANSNLAPMYHNFLDHSFGLNSGANTFILNIHHWINDFGMAVFFFLIGMEIKREMIEGHLSTNKQRALPVIAAIGGVIMPVIIYSLLNYGHPIALRGWAVPSATDIAFALGVLALCGKRLPASLRVFLTALAIIDDLIAVMIIALFYTDEISTRFLVYILVCVFSILILNRMRIILIPYYLILGIIMWYCFLQSGIHATISGVLLGLLIPLNHPNKSETSPLRYLERNLTPLVSYIILPVFAFANSGLSLHGFHFGLIYNTITLGVILGLFLGKQIGVFGTVLFMIKVKVLALPEKTNYLQFYGVAILCGIGFTMSLFIGILGFADYPDQLNHIQLGVFIGSALSAITGMIVLYIARKYGRVRC